MAQRKRWTAGQFVSEDDINRNFSENGLNNVSITYDGSGNIAQIVDNDEGYTYAFTYDTNGLLYQVVGTKPSKPTSTWTFSWDSAGALTGVTRT